MDFWGRSFTNCVRGRNVTPRMHVAVGQPLLKHVLPDGGRGASQAAQLANEAYGMLRTHSVLSHYRDGGIGVPQEGLHLFGGAGIYL